MKEKEMEFNSDVSDALLKKALGFSAVETVEEYVNDDGEIRLVKKKVTKKDVPPDTTAIKMIMDDRSQDVSEMSDEELENEKMRLIGILKQRENKGENKCEKKKKTDKKKPL